ncbi:type II toxin-antitoxin system Phd/YefM family antitoxin [Candidatus Shapirobacteria bacterium]|nr:type II toxin-antitoxin system Phd/YefM family antitoxin [Candidatus Shapirobacteria bacterium]
MLQPINIAEARSNFSELLGQAFYGGKKFLIKKMGKPYVVLVGVEDYLRLEKAREYFFDQIEKQRRKAKDIPLAQVEKDISRAVSLVRKRK